MSNNLIREQVLLKPETIKQIKAKAKEASTKKSTIMRQIIEFYFKELEAVKKLTLLIAIAILFIGCDKLSTKCWQCEIYYLDLKTNKLIVRDDTLNICGKTREDIAPREMNGKFTHPQYGVVRKVEYCEEANGND